MENKSEYNKLVGSGKKIVPEEEMNGENKPKSQGSTFLRLLKYTYKHKLLLVIGNISLVVTSLSMVAIPYLTGQYFFLFSQMIDSITNSDEKSRLNNLTLQFLFLMIISGLFSFSRAVAYNLLGERVSVELRVELFGKLMSKDIEFFDQNRSGELISRLTSDISIIQSGASDTISILLRNIIQFIGSLGLLWLLSWKLTLVLIGVIPPFVVLVIIFIKYFKTFSKMYQQITAEATQVATEALGNMRVVRSFSTEIKEIGYYDKAIQKAYKVGVKRAVLGGSFQGVGMTLGFGVILGILYYGGTLVIDGQLSVGDLSSFILYTLTMTVSLLSVSGMLNTIVQSAAISEKIFSLMDEPINVIDGNNSTPIQGSIQMKDVSFYYPSKQNVPVLQKITLNIQQGEVVAFVGQSGSGKSTIVSLLERFYDIQEGQILIDGIDIKSFQIRDLHMQIGFVSQEPTLFSGTLEENITYGVNNATLEQIETAMKMANAYDFVSNPLIFPEGLKTIVGERGVKLSGGQKQRIAIARALIKNPKILIFDEATSALDSESEYSVQSAIDELVKSGQKTIILIAHRLSTVINSHNIVVIQNGQIAEMGTHKDLVSRNGVYKQLIEKQLS